MDIQNSLTI